MSLLDFTEIESGECFEDLIEELLHLKGMNPIRSGEGPDRGRDILATELLEGQFTEEARRTWVVECKHGAVSKRSVSERDIGTLIGIISKHNAHGYLLITSTRPTINLEESIRAINDNQRCDFSAHCWTALDLERELTAYPTLVKKYFPRSYAASLLSSPHWAGLVARCQEAIETEIHATVGGKYVPKIYVDRSIRRNLHEFLSPDDCRVNHALTLHSRFSCLAHQSLADLSRGLSDIDASLTHKAEKAIQDLPLSVSLGALTDTVRTIKDRKSKLESQLQLRQAQERERKKLRQAQKREIEELPRAQERERKKLRQAQKREIKKLRQAQEREIKKLRQAQERERGKTNREKPAFVPEVSNKTKEVSIGKLRKHIQEVSQLLQQLNILATVRGELQENKNSRAAIAASLQNTGDTIASTNLNCLPFPSNLLFDEIANITRLIKKSITSFKKLAGNEDISTIEKHADDARALEGEWRLVQQATRPVYLLIDRAGGGKTNLLCRLAQEISNDSLCFFITARSVPDATSDAITDYINSTYNICSDESDNIAVAKEWCALHKRPLVFIIDGINESTNPTAFNQALRNLIKKYYGTDTRFFISCRDVYWEFFKDDFWEEHAKIVEDTLYTFTVEEYKKALPLYLKHFHIVGRFKAKAKEQLRHPLLLRFFCEAYKGQSEDDPANMELVDSIRLKKLFDDYSRRKFFEIRKRLGLADSREIEEYIFMIARLMLEHHSRLVASDQVAIHARNDFGETSIRNLSSRYMQIRDEDIIIEERPIGTKYILKTGFVYDEFMEYVIAKSTMQKIEKLTGNDLLSYPMATQKAVMDLLDRRNEFISVVGAAEYLVTFIAEENIKVAHNVLDEMQSKGFESIVCRAISKWPRKLVDPTVYELMKVIHSKVGVSRDAERLAWRVLESHCGKFPKSGIDYVTSLEHSKNRRPAVVFSFISRVSDQIEDRELLRICLSWTIRCIRESPFVSIGDPGCLDFKSGVRTVSVLAEKLRRYIPERHRTQLWRELEPVMRKSIDVGTGSVGRNLRSIFLNLKNRSKSYREFRATWITFY